MAPTAADIRRIAARGAAREAFFANCRQGGPQCALAVGGGRWEWWGGSGGGGNPPCGGGPRVETRCAHAFSPLFGGIGCGMRILRGGGTLRPPRRYRLANSRTSRISPAIQL